MRHPSDYSYSTTYLMSEYLCPFACMLKAVHSTFWWTHVANILELSPDIFVCTEFTVFKDSWLSNTHSLYSSCSCLTNVLKITWTQNIASFPAIWSVFVVLLNRMIAYARLCLMEKKLNLLHSLISNINISYKSRLYWSTDYWMFLF